MHRTPKYVQIYNQMMSMIKRSQFPPGSKLPSEEKLTQDFKISRVTLRTALSLLREDGMIHSIHGQGHFVATGTSTESYKGISNLSCPIMESLNLPSDQITEKDAYYYKNPSSIFTDRLFQVQDLSYLTINVWYKSYEQNVANIFSIILPETVRQFGLDLEDSDCIIQFLETDIYKKVLSSQLTITISTRDVNSFRRKFPKEQKLVLLTEDLYSNDGELLAQNKYYIPETFFRTSLTRYQADYTKRINR
ncbi:GntR family transcriptional regulator [Tetragenococcus halophilus]|uniref:GntR family transcriptional regulator n=1 Tax=Tetragenococcus halophilus TaxID=51669 RepID=A0A3G5FHJ9_TETHA|nr:MULTISPECIES: winged helix-turn-helix domain-containing protein [Tetragenococcus]AYW49827.1 GntR family transcriptional regulator [Tetragenococcus halophilus]GBD63039.1 hypothetical protein TEHD23766T_0466 [Tetragenococcus halophilus subsp. flandriensis]GFK21386.1 GntR family transcriptional regulator [Tetragenococcus halophilus]GMA46451.1 hypothetical protein GCM10025854_07010 [Tetragenococcus muriaticus]